MAAKWGAGTATGNDEMPASGRVAEGSFNHEHRLVLRPPGVVNRGEIVQRPKTVD
jgi:hypothetical protein